ncbi:MAG: hypothetical protein HY391_05525 [Deltaproteobacteria bacterium]|nr:hypothetical protein [Deltaproteobacteria bacterium]
MPKDEYDPEDPLEWVGVEVPVESDENLHEMALTFAEEFLRGGFSEDELLAMFKNPFYVGPHLVWRKKNEAYVRAVIEEAKGMWMPMRTMSGGEEE